VPLPRDVRGDDAPAGRGLAECATITKSGIKTDVVHRWPDVVGRPIDPGDGRAPHPSWADLSAVRGVLAHEAVREEAAKATLQ
jgi:hypothetical protein